MVPTWLGGRGSPEFGNVPNFYRFLNLKASLSVSTSQPDNLENAEMRRTRSQTKSLSTSATGLSLAEGDIVFAHRGRKIPFWWPGKIVRKQKRGYKVEFFIQFGKEDCLSDNVVTPEQFEALKLKSANSKLFKIPEQYVEVYANACKKIYP